MSFTKPLRVGYVVRRYPRYSETFVVREILAHEAAGLEVEIFALEPPVDTHFQDIIARVRAPVNYLSTRSLKADDFWMALEKTSGVFPDLWKALELARGEEVHDIYHAVVLAHLVRIKAINHLHAHFATSATTVARLASLLAQIPYSFTAHAYDIFNNDKVQPEKLRIKLLDAAAVITISDYNLEYLRQTYGHAASGIERIYNGLDLDQYSYREPDRRSPNIVSVARLIEKKGFGDLIDACAILAKRSRKFICRIIGTGPLEGELRAQIERLGVQKWVHLVGPRPESEVIKYIRNAAVFALPCIIGSDGNRDGLPTTLLEAAALGTPCVSTDVAGIPELVRDGETGLLVRQHDPYSLATAMEKLLTSPKLRVGLSRGARRLVEEEFDINLNSARIRTIFQDTMREVISNAQKAS